MSAWLPCAASDTSETVSVPLPVLILPPALTVTTASMLILVSVPVTLSLPARLSEMSSGVVSVPGSLTAGPANNPAYPAIALSANATFASITPVLASSTQLPPLAVAPVASVDAAMSALVTAASCVMRAAPLGPAATSQPNKRMSASAARCVPQACICALWLLSVALFKVSLPSVTAPLLPWLMIWIDSMPVLLPMAWVMASSPDSPALITRT